jgi:dTMP kinase
MLASAPGMPERGRLITIEGLDGAGKTTVAGSLAESLGESGIDVSVLREPGGVEASERIRELVKDPSARIGARAEALLYAAARAQLVEDALTPLLGGGTWVVLDRFVDSSLAYQGGGRVLGIEPVRAVNEFATGGLVPDRTLLLALDPAIGRERARARAEAADRLELEDDEFFARIASAYDELAAAEPERIRVIDAAQPPDAVLAAALDAIADLVSGVGNS